MGDLSTFMVSTEDGNSTRISNLKDKNDNIGIDDRVLRNAPSLVIMRVHGESVPNKTELNYVELVN